MEHGRALELKKSPTYNLWEIVGSRNSIEKEGFWSDDEWMVASDDFNEG